MPRDPAPIDDEPEPATSSRTPRAGKIPGDAIEDRDEDMDELDGNEDDDEDIDEDIDEADGEDNSAQYDEDDFADGYDTYAEAQARREQWHGAGQRLGDPIPTTDAPPIPLPTVNAAPQAPSGHLPSRIKKRRIGQATGRRAGRIEGADALPPVPGHYLVDPASEGPRSPARPPTREERLAAIQARIQGQASPAVSTSVSAATSVSSPKATFPPSSSSLTSALPSTSASSPSLDPLAPRPFPGFASPAAAPAFPLTPLEKLRVKLDELVREEIQRGNVRSWSAETLRVLHTLVSNVARDPSNPKFRSLRFGNPRVRKHIIEPSPPGGLHFLVQTGFAGMFSAGEAGLELKLPKDLESTDPEKKNAAEAKLEEQLGKLKVAVEVVDAALSRLAEEEKKDEEKREKMKRDDDERKKIAMRKFEEDRRLRWEQSERDRIGRAMKEHQRKEAAEQAQARPDGLE